MRIVFEIDGIVELSVPDLHQKVEDFDLFVNYYHFSGLFSLLEGLHQY